MPAAVAAPRYSAEPAASVRGEAQACEAQTCVRALRERCGVWAGLAREARPVPGFEPLRCTWGHPVLAERVEVHVQPPRGGAADQVGPEALEQPGPPLEAHDAAHAVEEPAVHRQPAALAAGVLHLHARLDQIKRVKDRRCKEAGAGAGGELLDPAALHGTARPRQRGQGRQGDKTPPGAATVQLEGYSGSDANLKLTDAPGERGKQLLFSGPLLLCRIPEGQIGEIHKPFCATKHSRRAANASTVPPRAVRSGVASSVCGPCFARTKR